MQRIEEINAAVNQRVEYERQQIAPGPEITEEPDELTSEEIFEQLNRNADGDTFIFIKFNKDRFVYDCAAGRWYKWNGNFFLEDLTGEILQAVNDVVDVYEKESKKQSWLRTKAAKELNHRAEAIHRDKQTALLKRIKVLQGLQRKQEILTLSRSGAGTLAITGNEWDRNPWLFAAANAIIDLKTGKARPGTPGDFIKTAAPTQWNGIDEPCPIFENFLVEVFDGNIELINFIQRLFGYGITGLSILHLFIILFGAGRNAKGTFLELMKSVIGDYALKTESELLLEQKNARMAGSPNSGILALRGRRIVWASETSDGRRLNAGRLKELVGGDTLNARPVFGKYHIEFSPSHLLLLLTNNKPSAPASDFALWQRVLLIPFSRSFVNDPKAPNEVKANPYLGEKLKAEASGILAWLVKGCLEWQQQGLNPPEIVMAATNEYRSDEDTIGHFIEERCTLGDALQVRAGELFAAWKSWAEATGAGYISGKRFGMEIKRRGFDSYKDKRGIFYIGISLTGEG